MNVELTLNDILKCVATSLFEDIVWPDDDEDEDENTNENTDKVKAKVKVKDTSLAKENANLKLENAALKKQVATLKDKLAVYQGPDSPGEVIHTLRKDNVALIEEIKSKRKDNLALLEEIKAKDAKIHALRVNIQKLYSDLGGAVNETTNDLASVVSGFADKVTAVIVSSGKKFDDILDNKG